MISIPEDQRSSFQSRYLNLWKRTRDRILFSSHIWLHANTAVKNTQGAPNWHPEVLQKRPRTERTILRGVLELETAFDFFIKTYIRNWDWMD